VKRSSCSDDYFIGWKKGLSQPVQRTAIVTRGEATAMLRKLLVLVRPNPTVIRCAAAIVLVATTAGLSGAHAAPPSSQFTHLYVKTVGYYGAVDVVPSGVQVGDCASYCKFAFLTGTVVTLTAQRAAGKFVGWDQLFVDWTQPCSGAGTRCILTMNASAAVKANFSPVALRVLASDGGRVDVLNAGPLSCGSGCTLFGYDSFANIRAVADDGNAFNGWSGGCANIGDSCNVRMNGNRLLGASFRCTASVCRSRHPLSTKVRFWVKVVGPGRVAGSGLTCSGSCSREASVGQQLSLHAEPKTGYSVRSWYGRNFACAPRAKRCMFGVSGKSSSTSPGLVVTFG
jgi:Divergent InlB B-repeat domain